MEYLDECPSSFSEVEKASRRLGCGKDKFGNNQYLCIPNAEKDSLHEFCHNGIMGLQEKGNCLKSSNGGLILENCTHFVFGCPEEYFRSSDIFKYPACQAINRKLGCYVFDPNCQPTGGDDACSNDGMVHWTLNIPIYVVMFFLTVAVGILVFAVWRKYRKSFKVTKKERAEDESHLLKDNENMENTADDESQPEIIDENMENTEDDGSQLAIIDDGCMYSTADSNISDPITTCRSQYERIHFTSDSNISDPITRSTCGTIYSKAVPHTYPPKKQRRGFMSHVRRSRLICGYISPYDTDKDPLLDSSC